MMYWQIAARGLVYAAGFVQVLLIAHVLGSSDFGEYSFLQSAAELALILSTLGSGLLFARSTARAPTSYFSTSGTIMVGLPLGIVVLLLVLAFGPRLANFVEVVVLVATVLVQTYNQLLLYQLRGRGEAVTFTVEPAFRSLVLLGALALLYAFTGVSLLSVLLAGLFSQVVSLIWLLAIVRPSQLKREEGPRRREQISALPTGLASFFSKKADLLLIGTYVAGPVLANFKIAFLLAEISYQMAQLVLVRETAFLSVAENSEARARLKKLAIEIASIAAVFSLLVCTSAYLAGPLIEHKYMVWGFLPGLAAYFVLKSIAAIPESLMMFRSQYRASFVAACLSSLLKFVALGGAALGVLTFNWAYAFLGVGELFIFMCVLARSQARVRR